MKDDVEALEAELRAALERRPEVLVAYLFGSTTRGSAGPLSDVDVAVLVREDRFDLQLDLIGDLTAALGSDRVDVVVLNHAPPALGYRVLRDGRLLLSRDERARIEHRVRTIDRYLDMEPLLRRFQEGVRHRIEEGRFGRP